MQKHLRRFLYASLTLLLVSQAPLLAQTTPGQSTQQTTDDEYTRYRQRGDDFFKAGRYEDARRQYRNCLEVPQHEEDTYAKQRISLCDQCLSLMQQATAAGQQTNNADMVARLTDVLAINPTDPIANGRLADLYLSQGNQLFQQKQYEQAKLNYGQGVAYAKAEGNLAKQSTLELQIRNSEQQLKSPVITYYTPKRTGLKIALGLLAVGSGYYAYTLRNDFVTQRDAYNAVAKTLDSDGDNIINTRDEYQPYSQAYNSLEAAQKKQGLYIACLSVAAAATLADLYLFVKKAKPRQAIGWHVKPASTSYGLAVGFRF